MSLVAVSHARSTPFPALSPTPEKATGTRTEVRLPATVPETDLSGLLDCLPAHYDASSLPEFATQLAAAVLTAQLDDPVDARQRLEGAIRFLEERISNDASAASNHLDRLQILNDHDRQQA